MVYVRAGTYSEQINNFSGTWPAGNSWTNSFKVAAYPGETVTLTGGIFFGDCCGNPANPQMSYWIFDGFKMTTNGIYVGAHVDHVRFINIDISNMTANGGSTCIQGGGGGTSGFNEFVNMIVHDCGVPNPTQVNEIAYGYYYGGNDTLIDNNNL